MSCGPRSPAHLTTSLPVWKGSTNEDSRSRRDFGSLCEEQPMTHTDYTGFGGRRILLGSDAYWDFGWRRPDVRSTTEHLRHAAALRAMPTFLIEGAGNDERKVCLWNCWRHPLAVAATGGKPFPGFHQLTGSCVGAGGGNTVFSLAAV